MVIVQFIIGTKLWVYFFVKETWVKWPNLGVSFQSTTTDRHKLTAK